MKPTRGGSAAFASAGLGIPVLAFAAFFGKDWVVETRTIARLRSESAEERFAAIRKLGAMRSARAVPRLLDIVESQLLKAASDPKRNSPLERTLARLAVVEIGPKAVPALLRRIRERPRCRDPGFYIWEASADLLGKIGPRAAAAAPALIAALEDQSVSVRLAAGNALEKITGDPQGRE